jgi:nicotinate-nucleotide--dimethylbenzimidazole phosphoribosyltransferase
MNFDEINATIPLPDEKAMNAVKARWDYIAKPVGGLGDFETIVTRIAGVAGGVDIAKRAAIVLAADNGVTRQGVSMTPAEITVTMAEFMAQGKSSVCIMAKNCNTDIILRDMGMFRRSETVRGIHIADGTADMSACAAMTAEQCERAINYGTELVRQAKEAGYKLLATGEMGIGNTTTSSAVAAVLLGKPVAEVTGRGVGLDDAGLAHKIKTIEKAIETNSPRNAFEALQKLGGFDIAGLCGVFIGGALYGIPTIVDGLIGGVAALVASKLCPRATGAMFASHLSAEPAAEAILAALGLTPVIRANMRLGEGTGAVASIPLIDLSVAVYRDMITYGDLGL